MRKTHNKFTKIQMEEMRSKLDALPPKEKEEFGAGEFIQGLEGTIRSLITDRGYSFANIAKMLAENGIQLSPNTIAAKMRELDRAGKGKAKSPDAVRQKSGAKHISRQNTINHKTDAVPAPQQTDAENAVGVLSTSDDSASSNLDVTVVALQLEPDDLLHKANETASVEEMHRSALGQLEYAHPHDAANESLRRFFESHPEDETEDLTSNPR